MSARVLRAGIANRRRAIGGHGTTGGERPSAEGACAALRENESAMTSLSPAASGYRNAQGRRRRREAAIASGAIHQWQEAEAAGVAFSIKLVRGETHTAMISSVCRSAGARRLSGGGHADHPMFFAEHRRIAELALAVRLPAVSVSRDWVEARGLVSYGGSLLDAHRRAAAYACGTEEADGAKAVAAAWAAPCPDDNLSVRLAIGHVDLVLRGAHCVGSCAGMNSAKTCWRCSLISREYAECRTLLSPQRRAFRE
jgi:hypothetical protein